MGIIGKVLIPILCLVIWKGTEKEPKDITREDGQKDVRHRRTRTPIKSSTYMTTIGPSLISRPSLDYYWWVDGTPLKKIQRIPSTW